MHVVKWFQLYNSQTFELVMCRCFPVCIRWKLDKYMRFMFMCSVFCTWLFSPPSGLRGSSGCCRASTGGSSGNTRKRRRFPCWLKPERAAQVPPRRRGSRTRSFWPRPGSSGSTRRAWRPVCRSWRTTTNSWSRSCAGSGSYCYRYTSLRALSRSVETFTKVFRLHTVIILQVRGWAVIFPRGIHEKPRLLPGAKQILFCCASYFITRLNSYFSELIILKITPNSRLSGCLRAMKCALL